MEVPAAFEADSIRDEKVKVLRSLAPLDPNHATFAQYSGGTVDGEAVPGYLQEPDMDQESQTETFVSIRLEVAKLALAGHSLRSANWKADGRTSHSDQGTVSFSTGYALSGFWFESTPFRCPGDHPSAG